MIFAIEGVLKVQVVQHRGILDEKIVQQQAVAFRQRSPSYVSTLLLCPRGDTVTSLEAIEFRKKRVVSIFTILLLYDYYASYISNINKGTNAHHRVVEQKTRTRRCQA